MEIGSNIRATVYAMRYFIIGDKIDVNNVPPEIFKILKANVSRIDYHKLKGSTGLKPRELPQALDNVINKFQVRENGWWTLRGDLTTQEQNILTALSFAKVIPAYTDIDIFRDFTHGLVVNNLLLDSERSNLKKSRTGIILNAIVAMHWSRVRLEKAWVAHLICGISDGFVVVASNSVVNPSKRLDVRGSFVIVNTSLRACEVCDSSLSNGQNETWAKPIDVSPAGTLIPL